MSAHLASLAFWGHSVVRNLGSAGPGPAPSPKETARRPPCRPACRPHRLAPGHFRQERTRPVSMHETCLRGPSLGCQLNIEVDGPYPAICRGYQGVFRADIGFPSPTRTSIAASSGGDSECRVGTKIGIVFLMVSPYARRSRSPCCSRTRGGLTIDPQRWNERHAL